MDTVLNNIAAPPIGETVEPPGFLRRSERSFRRVQQKQSRRVKGSNRGHKQKMRVERCHAKVSDQRRDFAPKLTMEWSERFDLIAFGDTDAGNMVHGNLAKSIHDAEWGLLRQMSAYRQRNRSRRYAEVPAKNKNTTQECSKCGRLSDPPVELKDTTYRCPSGHTEDRYVNAAENIPGMALKTAGQGMSELTHVETGHPPLSRGRRVRSLNRGPPAAKEAAF
jgi:putative transposase